jgi:predicted DNA-binding transcriptional regulator AlpA
MNTNETNAAKQQTYDVSPVGRLLRRQEVEKLVGRSAATLYRWSNDPDNIFPNRIVIGPRSSAWTEKSIVDWLDAVANNGGQS